MGKSKKEERTKRKHDDQSSQKKKKRKIEVDFKYPIAMNKNAQVTNRFNLKVAEVIKKNLTTKQCQMFRESCFGAYLDREFSALSGLFVHALLSREIRPVEIRSNEMCFNVNGVELSYGEREFGLITGLPFGNTERILKKLKKIKKKGRFVKKYFRDIAKPRHSDIEASFNTTNWAKQEDEDALLMAMLYFIHGNIYEKGGKRPVHDYIWDLIEDAELFRNYPWGVVAFQESFRTLSIALDGRLQICQEIDDGKRTGRVPYQLYGFTHAFQVWILELWKAPRIFYTRIVGDIFPRLLRWTQIRNTPFGEIQTMFENATPPENTSLEPEEKEKECGWFQPLMDYIEGREEEEEEEQEEQEEVGVEEEEEEEEDDEVEEEERDEEDEEDDDFEIRPRVEERKAIVEEIMDQVNIMFTSHQDWCKKQFASMGDRLTTLEVDVNSLKTRIQSDDINDHMEKDDGREGLVMAKRKQSDTVLEELKRVEDEQNIVDLTHEDEQTDLTEVIRELRDVRPAHYLFKIENFSLLQSNPKIDNYESSDFEVSGYKWRLSVYPKGKNENNKHVSLYLVLSDSNSLPLHKEVNVYFKLFVYNQIQDKYLTVQDAKGRISRFRGTKTEFGFDQLLLLDVFKDASNGYLIDDCCIFGAEIFVVDPISKGECATVVNYPSNNTYTWNVQNFAELKQEKPCKSEVFSIGGYKWRLLLYPNGHLKEKGKSLSLFLQLEDALEPGHTLSVDFDMLVIDQLRGKHHKPSGVDHFCQFFASTSLEWGSANVIPLSKLNDTSEGYLINGSVIVEVKISTIAMANEFS